MFFEILFLKLKKRIFENTNEGFFYISLFTARQKDENPKFSKKVGVGVAVDRTLIFRGGMVGQKKFTNKNVFLCHNKEFKLGNSN